jgi:hypothetical protein
MAARHRNKLGRFTKGYGRNKPASASQVGAAKNRTARRRSKNKHQHVRGYYPNKPGKKRRYGRNPVGFTSGLGIGFLLNGLQDGAAVFGGQIANRKLANLLQGKIPGLSIVAADGSASVVGVFGSRVLSAVAVSLVARQVVPRYSKLIAAGAFADAIGATLSTIPAAAPFIGATTLVRPRVAAYPQAPRITNGVGRVGVGAYPRSMGLPVNVGGM